MRQMDTILVAVGVPTKEVPGASFALSQPITTASGTVDIPDQTPSEKQETETQNQGEKGETCTEERGDMKDLSSDGWDIPDISDLLDSLTDTESASQIEARNDFLLVSEERAPDEDTDSALKAAGGSVEEADPDSEHISWSWHDTNWTVEHTHTKEGSQTCKEHVTGSAAAL